MLDATEVSKKHTDKFHLSGRLSKKLLLPAIVGLALILSVTTAIVFYKKYDNLANNPTTAQAEKNKAETQRVLDKVKSAILLTDTSAPTIARVEDPEKLKSSNVEFYKDIQKGDYLVIYPKRAIVYRESNNQIINVAPIINTADLKDQSGTQPAETTTTQQKATPKATTR